MTRSPMRARCSCSSSQQGLVIGFGAINAGELPAAVRLLSDVLGAQS
jgi:hypothetical protein